MNLRSARAERGAAQPKGHVSFSEAGRDWNVRWRATSHAQNPVKPPRHDFSTFLAPVQRAFTAGELGRTPPAQWLSAATRSWTSNPQAGSSAALTYV